jgi:hypothetical protein
MTTYDAKENDVNPDDNDQLPVPPDLTIVDAWEQVVTFEGNENLETSRLPDTTLEFSEE